MIRVYFLLRGEDDTCISSSEVTMTLDLYILFRGDDDARSRYCLSYDGRHP